MNNDLLTGIWPEWHVVRILGKGSHGTVYEVEKNDPSGTGRAALKVINVSAGDRTRELIDGFIEELMVEESLKNCENIVSIENYRAVEKADHSGWDIYILMELLTSLSDVMAQGTLDESRVIDLGIDICSALEQYEIRNKIHGGIKPENIFISSAGKYKLADFSIDKLSGEVSDSLTMKDAFSFNAPEVQLDGKYSKSSDTYSLGMLLYVLTNNNMMPFTGSGASDANSPIAAAARRFNGEVLPAPANASADLAQVIKIACDPDPEERFSSAAAMKNALKELKAEHALGNAPSARVKLVTPPPTDAPVRRAPQRTQEPVRRTNPAKIIIPIVIAVLVTALIVLAIIFIPRLFKQKSSSKPAAENSAITQAETEAALSEAPTPAETQTTAANATTAAEEPARQYSKGDIITMGTYEQDGNTQNGTEQIEWIVLDVQADRLLVISRYGLDSQQYDSSGSTKVTWETCTLRQWLNGTFYSEAFSSDEQAKIVESYVRADKNAQYADRDAGADTVDKVFLLSTSEAEKFFSSDAARKVEVTEYSKTRGVTYCNNKDNQGYGYWWWLRSPGRDADYAALVFPEGKVDYVGYHYNDTENAVRPAMWIKP